jgi:hypothetical protein
MPPLSSDLTNHLSEMIKLALAPVFLLTAIGAFINVHANRLGRIVDRRRVLENRNEADDHAEFLRLTKRIELAYVAIVLAVFAALCVCLVTAGAFIGALFGLDLSRLLAIIFVVALLSLTASLLAFLRETFIATVAAHSRHVKAQATGPTTTSTRLSGAK